jgi:hypothetical protein
MDSLSGPVTGIFILPQALIPLLTTIHSQRMEPPSRSSYFRHLIQSKANIPLHLQICSPRHFFTIICAQWPLMCEYVNTRLGQIEWETEHCLSNLYARDFDHTLKTLLTRRRQMPIYHAFTERAISRLSARCKSKDSTTPFNPWEDILTNLRDILHRIEILHCRADKI